MAKAVTSSSGLSRLFKKPSTIIAIAVIGCLLILAFCGVFTMFCGICAFLTPVNEKSEVSESQPEVLGTISETNLNEEEIITYKVVSITDGDTIKIMYHGKKEPVRLVGIDTPETNECFNKEATEKLRSLVLDKEIRVEFDTKQDERDRYDRLLFFIWVDDVFINEVMIEEGYAEAYRDLPYDNKDQFIELEKEAKDNGLGVWGQPCDCLEGEEVSRKCFACNKAMVMRNHWDCSLYEVEIDDNACTDGCYVAPEEPAAPPPVVSPPQGLTTPVILPLEDPTTPTYTCDCNKACSQMSSCDEAKYQLITCSCSKRDGDNDGVPCEDICPGG